MSWTLCTEAEAIAKAGSGANTTFAASTATLAAWSDEVEGSINTITRRDWVTNPAGNAEFEGIVEDLCSDLVAMKIVSYDMSGYTKILEATTILDILNNNSVRNIEILKLEENKEKMD